MSLGKDVADSLGGSEDDDYSGHSGESSQPHSPISAKSDPDADDGTVLDSTAPLPSQKRRRVTRACDECRRKKIKCDGKQPCTHCHVYTYDCTYDKPSNRRRNPAPQYVEALENRLNVAETLLRKFMPDVDLNDPSLDPSVQLEFRKRAHAHARAQAISKAGSNVVSNNQKKPAVVAPPSPDRNGLGIASMLESCQLDPDDEGGWDYHGTSSGAVFLQRMKEHFGGMLGPPGLAPFLPRLQRRSPVSAIDSSPSVASPFGSTVSDLELPDRKVARSLCHYSLTCATCLFRFVHVPSFYESLDQLYEKPPDSFTEEDVRFVGLLHAVMALGCMYDYLDESTSRQVSYEAAVDEGLKYYFTSKSLLQNITDCRDLISLQALLYMILFLQATSNLSTCYAFLGIAQRCALRMGLHRHLEHAQLSPIEQEVGRRVFYSIRQMDIYVSVLLGFPVPLDRDEIDQPYPTEVDDEYITREGILPAPAHASSVFQAFNAHTSLMEILAKISKYVYPKTEGTDARNGNNSSATYRVSYARIKEIEAELQDWHAKLPEAWRPTVNGTPEQIRIRYLLRFTYAHVQLVLYRPFLHYVSPRLSASRPVSPDDLSYACGANQISVSRNLVRIGSEMRKQGVFGGPYWFMLYTEFFAVLSLVFYVMENPDKPGSMNILADARCGRQNVAQLAKQSLAADRITIALNQLFEQLSANLDRGGAKKTLAASAPSKKRTAPAGRGQAQAQAQTGHRRSMDARAYSTGPPASGPRNAMPRRSTDGYIPSHVAQVHSQQPELEQTFIPCPADLVSIDASTQGSPDSSSPTDSPHARPHPEVIRSLKDRAAMSAASSLSATYSNPVHKISSLLFPSEDPFAYPDQPVMELSFGDPHYAQKSHQDSTVAGDNDMGPTQLLIQGFEGMDGQQLLGQMPSYMMQQPSGGGDNGVVSPGDVGRIREDGTGTGTGTQQQQTIGLREFYGPTFLTRQRLHEERGDGAHAHVQPQPQPGQIQDVFMDSYQADWVELFSADGFQGM